MKKLLSIVVLGALVLAACGSGSTTPAASVDGEGISVSDINGLIDADGANITKEDFAQFLSFAIQWKIINSAAEADYGVASTDAEVSAEADRIYNDVAEEGQSREEFLSTRGVTEEFLQNIARQGLLDGAIREQLLADVADPTAEEIDASRSEAAAALTNACVSHILVETAEEAADVFARLDAGEDFGELAGELSTDTGSGANNGILPCAAPSTYVEPFRDAVLIAPVGEVYEEAVESQFGFHVILVTDRTEPTEADLPTDEELADTVRDAAVLTALEEWFLGAMEAADVTVEEEFGSWQPNPPTVVAPAGE